MSAAPTVPLRRSPRKYKLNENLRDTDQEKILKEHIIAQMQDNEDNEEYGKWKDFRDLCQQQGASLLTIPRFQTRVTAILRPQVQAQGQLLGCHECGKRVEIDKCQPWTADHIPAVNLIDCAKGWAMGIRPAVKGQYHYTGKTFLFPQCDKCRIAQAGVVTKANALATYEEYTKLSRGERALLGSRVTISEKTCIQTMGTQASTTEKQVIQRLGFANGCHVCGTTYPCRIYNGDHVFPSEFCTPYMEKIFELLDIEYPDTFFIAPQCPSCSNRQGGEVAAVAAEAQAYGHKIGVPIGKGEKISGAY